MGINGIPGGRIGHFLAGAAVASVIGGTAVALTSTDFTYSARQDGYFAISPMAMSPGNSSQSAPYDTNWIPPVLGGVGCYQASVNLPQGAKLARVNTYYRSNESSDLTIYFVRGDPTSNVTASITATIPDDSNSRKVATQTVTGGLATIDNAKFNYGYGVCLDDGTLFYGARLVYSYKSAGD